jgi:hypothetical protein
VIGLFSQIESETVRYWSSEASFKKGSANSSDKHYLYYPFDTKIKSATALIVPDETMSSLFQTNTENSNILSGCTL